MTDRTQEGAIEYRDYINGTIQSSGGGGGGWTWAIVPFVSHFAHFISATSWDWGKLKSVMNTLNENLVKKQ